MLRDIELPGEILPLVDKDCFRVVECRKSGPGCPLHCSKDYEMTFVEHASGSLRVVGDSVEEAGDLDLVFITGQDLPHGWLQGSCSSDNIREITIMMSQEMFYDELISMNQFKSVWHMVERARQGLAFSREDILEVYPILDTLALVKDPFERYLKLLTLCYTLSFSENARTLAGSYFVGPVEGVPTDRIMQIRQYVDAHFSEDLTLGEVADAVCMSPSALSRYFRTKTGRTLQDYVIDVRLGYAARMLAETSKSVSEICYECGFNNQSNFNRIFKSKRGLTPREFRALYRRFRDIV